MAKHGQTNKAHAKASNSAAFPRLSSPENTSEITSPGSAAAAPRHVNLQASWDAYTVPASSETLLHTPPETEVSSQKKKAIRVSHALDLGI